MVPHAHPALRPAAGADRAGAAGTPRHRRLALFDGRLSRSTWALILGVCAAPGLLVIGVPFATPRRTRSGSSLGARQVESACRRPGRDAQPGGVVSHFKRDAGWRSASGSAPRRPRRVEARCSGRELSRRPVTPTRSWIVAPCCDARKQPRSSTVANGPTCSRCSTMAAAVAGPIPGSASSSAVVAVLTSTGPAEPATVRGRRGVTVPGTASMPSPTAGTAMDPRRPRVRQG